MKISNRFSASCLIFTLCLSLTTVTFNVAAQPAQDESRQPSGNMSDESVDKTSQSGNPADGLKPWKEEFERICAQTTIATSLTPAQLQVLIRDSDDLLKRLGKVADPWAKIYIFRLRKCSDFFKFALELNESKL